MKAQLNYRSYKINKTLSQTNIEIRHSRNYPELWFGFDLYILYCIVVVVVIFANKGVSKRISLEYDM
jgi:hypothetical protein